MARPKKVRLTPPDTESQLREALIEQSKGVSWDKVEMQSEVTVMPEVKKEAKKEHKTWNHHMHSDAKGFYGLMKGKWDKLTDSDLLMVNTEGNLVSAVAKRYEMPEDMAQATVTDWMKTL